MWASKRPLKSIEFPIAICRWRWGDHSVAPACLRGQGDSGKRPFTLFTSLDKAVDPLYFVLWWRGQDSNLRSHFRRQIYSLLVLATHPPLHFIILTSPLPFRQRPPSLGQSRPREGAEGSSGDNPAGNSPQPEPHPQPERGFEPTNLPITSRLRCPCATRAFFQFSSRMLNPFVVEVPAELLQQT